MELLIEYYGADEETINKCIEKVAKDKKVDPRDVRTIVTLNVYQPVLHLPQEIFEMIASKMSAADLLGLCSASREMRYRCGDSIWKNIYKRDFDERKAFPGETWKQNYMLIKSSPEQVAAGYGNSGVILDDNVYTWGDNLLGQLGRETEKNFDYTPQKVKIPSKSPPVQISMFDTMAGVVLQNGDVYIWGTSVINSELIKIGKKKVGISGVHRISVQETHVGFVLKNGEVYMMGVTDDLELEEPYRVYKEIDNAVDIKCSNTNTAILTADNKMYITGSNSNQQLSLVSEATDDMIAQHDLEEIEQGNTYNKHGHSKLFMADFKEPVSRINVGWGFMGAIVGNSIWMWGRAKNNTLGDGDTKNTTPRKVCLKSIKKPIFLACTTDSSAAVTADGKLYTWGETLYECRKTIPSHIKTPAGVKKDVFQVARGDDGRTVVMFKDREVKVCP